MAVQFAIHVRGSSEETISGTWRSPQEFLMEFLWLAHTVIRQFDDGIETDLPTSLFPARSKQRSGRSWTDEDKRMLLSLSKDMRIDEVALRLGRTTSACSRMLSRLKRSPLPPLPL